MPASSSKPISAPSCPPAGVSEERCHSQSASPPAHPEQRHDNRASDSSNPASSAVNSRSVRSHSPHILSSASRQECHGSLDSYHTHAASVWSSTPLFRANSPSHG